jgi:hypothetical protein
MCHVPLMCHPPQKTKTDAKNDRPAIYFLFLWHFERFSSRGVQNSTKHQENAQKKHNETFLFTFYIPYSRPACAPVVCWCRAKA